MPINQSSNSSCANLAQIHPQTNMSSYETLASNTTNPLTKQLLSIILSKKSNLAVSIDVTSPESLVSIIRAVGPYVCIVKVLSPPPQLTLLDAYRYPNFFPRDTDTGPAIIIPRTQLPYLRRPEIRRHRQYSSPAIRPRNLQNRLLGRYRDCPRGPRPRNPLGPQIRGWRPCQGRTDVG